MTCKRAAGKELGILAARRNVWPVPIRDTDCSLGISEKQMRPASESTLVQLEIDIPSRAANRLNLIEKPKGLGIPPCSEVDASASEVDMGAGELQLERTYFLESSF